MSSIFSSNIYLPLMADKTQESKDPTYLSKTILLNLGGGSSLHLPLFTQKHFLQTCSE